MGLRYGLKRLRELGITPTDIRLIGGGAKSPVWRQIVADVFNLPLACPQNEEGPAFGAALQALWCLEGGDIQDLTSKSVTLAAATRSNPSKDRAAAYEEVYAVYEELADTMINSPVFSAHRDLIRE
jgi:sugar (pentulose or hexulose) kinase